MYNVADKEPKRSLGNPIRLQIPIRKKDLKIFGDRWTVDIAAYAQINFKENKKIYFSILLAVVHPIF